MTTIPHMPPAPDPNNRETFDELAYPFTQAMEPFGQAANALADEVNEDKQTVTQLKQDTQAIKDAADIVLTDCHTELVNCQAEVENCEIIKFATKTIQHAVEQTVNATCYESSKTGGYLAGDRAYSPVSGELYTALQDQPEGSVMPLSDKAFWRPLLPKRNLITDPLYLFTKAM